MKKVLICLLSIIIIGGINNKILSEKKPSMEYQYTLEKNKLEKAQLIWNSCIEDLRKRNILDNDDIVNINQYIRTKMVSSNIESPQEKCERQKNVLKLSILDEMVRDKVITTIQSEKLRSYLNRQNLIEFVN